MMKPILRPFLLTLSAATVLCSFSAQAMVVSTVGSFSNPDSTSYMVSRIYNQDDATSGLHNIPINATTGDEDAVAYFGWGFDSEDSSRYHQLIQSHFWFNGYGSAGSGSSGVDVLSGQTFAVGYFRYTNEQTIFSGGVVQIDFDMAINIDGVLLPTATYRLEIDNTQNILSLNYDTARLISGPGDILFTLDGMQYKLSFNGFSRDLGLTYETYANLAEGDQTGAKIFATITAVPVPAAAWLFGSGLVALLGFARTRK